MSIGLYSQLTAFLRVPVQSSAMQWHYLDRDAFLYHSQFAKVFLPALEFFYNIDEQCAV